MAETFLKALPPEEEPSDLPPTTPPAIGVDGGETGASVSASAAGAGSGSAAAGAAIPATKQRFRPIALITEERAAELREVLKEMLIEFLELCRQLVLKSRTVLTAPRAAGEERTLEEVSREAGRTGHPPLVLIASRSREPHGPI